MLWSFIMNHACLTGKYICDGDPDPRSRYAAPPGSWVPSLIDYVYVLCNVRIELLLSMHGIKKICKDFFKFFTKFCDNLWLGMLTVVWKYFLELGCSFNYLVMEVKMWSSSACHKVCGL